MTKNWVTYKLSDIMEIGSSKRIFMSDYVADGIPFYRSKEIIQKHNKMEISTELFITKEKYNQIESKFGVPKSNEILLTSVGTIGIPFIIPEYHEKFYFKDGNLTWFKNYDLTLINPKYLYFYFISDIGRSKFQDNLIGSTQQALTISALRNIKISIPSLSEQGAIASILSALDDKIELNLQMNKTLEEMAMTLYKHWFVDFGPFKDGELVSSELGEIPKGWEVKRLDEILEIRRGGSPRPIQDFLATEGLPWLKISDATASNSPFLYSTKEFIKVEGLNKTVLIKPGNIILSNSATPGLPRLIEFDTCIHDGWLHFPKIKRFNRYILYLLFLHIKEHLIQQGNGSVFTNLKTDILKAQLISLPTKEVEKNFTDQITPWFEKIKSNTEENLCLTSLRDTLLPKLISGEVRVKDAARSLAEVL